MRLALLLLFCVAFFWVVAVGDSCIDNNLGLWRTAFNLAISLQAPSICLTVGTFPCGANPIIVNYDGLTISGPQTNVDPRPSQGSSRTPNPASEAVLLCDFVVSGQGFTLNGVTIVGAIYLSSPNFKLQYSIISLSSATGIDINSNSALVEKNLFTGGSQTFSNFAINVRDGTLGTTITFNEFKFDSSATGGAAIHAEANCTISYNIIQPLSTRLFRGIELKQLGTQSNGGQVLSNTIVATLDAGLRVESRKIVVAGNMISLCIRNTGQFGTGIRVVKLATEVAIVSNYFLFNGMQDGSQGYTSGVWVETDNPQSSGISVSGNCFVDNQVGLAFSGAGTLNAQQNWWGHRWGPYPTGFGDVVSAVSGSSIAIDNFLTSAPVPFVCTKLIQVDTPKDPYMLFNQSFVAKWNISAPPLALPADYIGDTAKLVLFAGTSNATLSSSAPLVHPGSNTFGTKIPSDFGFSRESLLFVGLSNTVHLPWVYGVSDLFEIDSDVKNITILSPNSSTLWKTGKSATVRWSMTGHAYGIDIVIFNATHNATLAHDFDSSLLEWRWNQVFTFITAGLYQIALISTGYGRTINCTSEAFTIAYGDAYFTIVKPNTGTVWISGSTVQIEWTSTGVTDPNVDVLLFLNGVLNDTIASAIPNTGQTSWMIPSLLEWSQSYSVEIQSSSDAETSGFSPDFEIDVVEKAVFLEDVPVESFFEPGTFCTCRWTAHGYVGRLKLTLILGLASMVLGNELLTFPNGTGEYTFFLPPNTYPADSYIMNLTSLDYSQVTDQTAPFPIDTKRIEDVHIQDGDVFESPGQVHILWTTIGTIDKVNISLIDENEDTVSMKIATMIKANLEEYQWTIPSGLNGSTNYSIQVTARLYPQVYSRSELLQLEVLLPSSSLLSSSLPSSSSPWSASSSFESSSSNATSESDSSSRFNSSESTSENISESDVSSSSNYFNSTESSSEDTSETSASHSKSVETSSSSNSGSDSDLGAEDGLMDWIIPALIGGGLLGILLMLCVLIILVVFAIVIGAMILRKRRGGSKASGDGDTEIPLKEFSSSASVRIDSQTLTIPFQELKIVKKLASGAFGTVFTAKWHTDIVAVKRFNFVDEDNIIEFENEIKTLVTLRHENVLLFMGACVVAPDYAIVTEYCANGSLNEKLHKPKSKMTFSWNMKMQILAEICSGLQYLHRRGIIHRDLKSHNVLLTKEFHAKLADFGLSKTKAVRENQMTSQVGTPLWMAPEVTLGKDYNETCDIFSLAIVMYELLTERLPYFDQKSMLNIHVRVATEKNFRPTLPTLPEEAVLSSKMERYVEVMVMAWNQEPSQRIPLADISECVMNELSLPPDFTPKAAAVGIFEGIATDTLADTLANDNNSTSPSFTL